MCLLIFCNTFPEGSLGLYFREMVSCYNKECNHLHDYWRNSIYGELVQTKLYF